MDAGSKLLLFVVCSAVVLVISVMNADERRWGSPVMIEFVNIEQGRTRL
jgi:hypothetical protein